MEIKYEAVFGDQGLFKGAPEYIEFIRFNDYSRELLWGDSNSINHLTFKDLKALPIVAMRRIIKEPKQWTWEDKKAGRLPEVGCRVNFCHKLNTNWRTGGIKYIDDQVTVIKADDIDRPFVYEVDRVEFNPIESPEEKAARLREEWFSKATFMTTYEIYDNLLSGDLPVPVKGEL